MAHRYIVGDAEIRPDERSVFVGGEPATIGARAFDLLLCLIEHRDRVVPKDELLARVWPGVIVEENNLQVQVSALRKLLGPQAVSTVPGRGYRFTAPVHGGGGDAPAGAAKGAPAATPAPDDAGQAPPHPPTIAVLPFDNLGADQAQAYFIDGVVEDVITELSRFHALAVIARSSSFSYRGKSVDVRTIAQELSVRYVVVGSIRRGADRIRVNAQLIDATSGQQIWAEKYDRAMTDVFTVQEELTRAIVAAVAPQIESSEFHKLRGAGRGSLTAYELAMKARDLARAADREAGDEPHAQALALAGQAIDIDPHCGIALGTVAYLRWRELWAGNAASADEALAAGLAAAAHAIAIDGGDHIAHLWQGMLQIFAGRHAAGLADLRRAHELNPNDALTLSLLGQYEAGAGDAERGIAHVSDALRLSPRDGMRWSFLNSLAWARFAAGDLVGAAETALQSIADAPRFYPPHLCLAVARAGQGDIDGAGAALATVRELAPGPLGERLAGHWTMVDPALRQRATQLLRVAAGLEDADAGSRTAGGARSGTGRKRGRH